MAAARARAEVRESSLPDLGMCAISDDRGPMVNQRDRPVYTYGISIELGKLDSRTSALDSRTSALARRP